MEIYIERTKEKIKKDFDGTVNELLTELSILPEEVLVIKNGSLVTEDTELTNEDEIKILSVISGG